MENEGAASISCPINKFAKFTKYVDRKSGNWIYGAVGMQDNIQLF